MKIQASGASPAAGAAPRAGEAGGSGFQVQASGLREASAAGPSSVLRAITSLDALLALQEASSPEERRRRAVRRGGKMLDALETLKLALLDGGSAEDASSALRCLRDSLGEEGGGFDDPRLANLLGEIDTRAAVELAKIEVGARGRAA